MHTLIAAIYFLLALFGFASSGTTLITRSTVDGADAIYSRTRFEAGVAHFECIASASGACHYTLFPRRCASLDGNCGDRPMDRLTIPAGSQREVIGLREFDACVAEDDAARRRDCSRPQ
ncbi:hypothetical protein [Lysobacter tyrosinilyticus]